MFSIALNFLKCFLWILGEELERRVILVSGCTERCGRQGQGRVTWLLRGCEKPMKRKGRQKIFYLN